MNFYWLYELPSWQLFALIIFIIAAISLFGAVALRGRLERRLRLTAETNDIIGYFLSFTGAFYGIMLGLVAVGAWETYNGASEAAEKEAAVVAALYRDVTNLPSPRDGRAQAFLRSYAWDVIHLEWPEQQQGKTPYSARGAIDKVAAEIGLVDPKSARDEIAMAEALRQLNALLEARRYRVEASNEALPSTLWVVIMVGGFLNIALTWFLVINNKFLDLAVNLLVATLLGAVLAFIIAMDNPFRGELSVAPDSMQNVYTEIMNGPATRPLIE